MKEKQPRDLHRDLRRQCDHLAGTGTGICLFGVWSMIKFVLDIIQERREIPVADGFPPWVSYLVVIILASIICLIVFSWYLFIGLSARSVALKGKKRVLYAIVAFISVLLIIQNDVASLLNYEEYFETIDVFIVTMIIDVNLVIALTEIIIINGRVLHLRRLIRKQEASAHES